MLITPFVSKVWLLLIPTCIFGLGHGVIIPSILTLMSGFAPLAHRAAFMSMNSMVLRGGQTIGPPLIGLFYAIVGVDMAFFAGTGLAVIIMATLFFTLE
jgi:MFS family permease